GRGQSCQSPKLLHSPPPRRGVFFGATAQRVIPLSRSPLMESTRAFWRVVRGPGVKRRSTKEPLTLPAIRPRFAHRAESPLPQGRGVDTCARCYWTRGYTESMRAPLALSLACLAAVALSFAGAQAFAAEMPEDFVYLRDIDPTILQDMRYAG